MVPRARVSVWPGRRCVPGIVAPILGEHAEQNVSLATSSDPRLRRPVCATAYGAPMSVPSNRVRHHGSTPPPQAVYPRRLMGVWGAYCTTRPIPGSDLLIYE